MDGVGVCVPNWINCSTRYSADADLVNRPDTDETSGIKMTRRLTIWKNR